MAECDFCDGTGFIPHDCGEDSCCCIDDDDEECWACDGTGETGEDDVEEVA